MKTGLALKTAALIAAMVFVGPRSSFASLYEYTYQGNPFNTFVAYTEPSQFTSQNAVTFSFFTNAPIAANTTFEIATSPSALGWSVSDGAFSYSSTAVGAGILDTSFVTTNALGGIVQWLFLTGLAATPSTTGSTIVSCGAAPCTAGCGRSAHARAAVPRRYSR